MEHIGKKNLQMVFTVIMDGWMHAVSTKYLSYFFCFGCELVLGITKTFREYSKQNKKCLNLSKACLVSYFDILLKGWPLEQ